MIEPKYQVGDVVTVRGNPTILDKTVITELVLFKDSDLLETYSGKQFRYRGKPIYVYGVEESEYWVAEPFIFPYQEPSDDFKTILAQVSDPSTITNPVTGPILEPA